MTIWKYIKADSFFKDFLPWIKNHKRKISGKSGRGQPMGFSDEEKKQIAEAVKKLTKEIDK